MAKNKKDCAAKKTAIDYIRESEMHFNKAMECLRIAEVLMKDKNAKVITISVPSKEKIAKVMAEAASRKNDSGTVMVNETVPTVRKEKATPAKNPVAAKKPVAERKGKLPPNDLAATIKAYEDAFVREDNTISLTAFNSLFGYRGNGADFTLKHVRLGHLKREKSGGIEFREAKRFIKWFYANV